MVIATWLAHSQNILTIKEAGGGWSIELEAFFFFGSLALFFMGAGKIALSGGSGAWE
jgi:putative oxidoreductase